MLMGGVNTTFNKQEDVLSPHEIQVGAIRRRVSELLRPSIDVLLMITCHCLGSSSISELVEVVECPEGSCSL